MLQFLKPSPPSWWSGLKLFPIRQFFLHRLVSTLVVEWIEIQRVKKEGLVIRSPPSWWSGLKFTVKIDAYTHGNVSTLVVEWIEMEMCYMRPGWRESPPSWWSGLKLRMAKEIEALPPSPPSWWSGLKCTRLTARCNPHGLHPRGGVD